MNRPLRIATRTSQLALWQAEEVRSKLLKLDDSLHVELVAIHSDGDIASEEGFAHFGYKGIFTKRIEAALLDGRADIAVHSMKDMHSELPESLMLAATLEREDPRDALLSPHYPSLEALPEGALLGTASVRREAIIKQLRPDLHIVPFRGNVPTRLEKLWRREVDATLLAVAGLRRLKLDAHITQILDPEIILPAACQGAIGMECRIDDGQVRSLLERLNHAPTFTAITAERGVLRAMDGDCKTPLSAFATLSGNTLTLRAQWLNESGIHRVETTGEAAEAELIGIRAGHSLKGQMT